jgi:hypothetical protein
MHMGGLQNNLWNDSFYCETMYPPLNPRLLDFFGCLKCYIFNKCVYAKWNLVINKVHQLCEGEFWVQIACNMHVYDGKVLAILVPFLAFSFTYNVNKVQKILALCFCSKKLVTRLLEWFMILFYSLIWFQIFRICTPIYWK